MTVATMLTDDAQRVTKIVVAPNTAPDPSDGFVGWIAEGWTGDPATGHPVWWAKISDSQWGPMIQPSGPPGPPGASGALGPHQPGATYAALTSAVVVNGTIWQCQVDHQATTAVDATHTAFELDAVQGRWSPLDAGPVRSFDPHLATTARPVTDGTTLTHVYVRQTGTSVVNRFRFGCEVAAGRVGVGVQRGTGGGSSIPGPTLAWYSGLVPAVATTSTQPPQELVVLGGLVVYAGDYLIFSSDDARAQFLTADGPDTAKSASLFEGASYVVRADRSSNTPPPDASGLAPAPTRGPLVVGRP